MSWFSIALTAYALLAFVNIIDKTLLGRFIKDPRAYTFLVGACGLLAIVLAPFGFHLLPWNLLQVALIAGVWQFLALHWFFRALRIGEVSRVIPLIGGGVPLFTTLLAHWLLGNTFHIFSLLAIILLTLGGVVIVYVPTEHHWWSSLIQRFRHHRRHQYLILAVASAFSFALSFTLSKFVFDASDFVTGFIWVRIGTFLASCSLLLIPSVRSHLHHTLTHFLSSTGALFAGNQLLGAIVIVLQSYAIALGNVAYVQALQGVQFAFVFIAALIASVITPHLLREYLTSRVLIEKSIALALITIGTAMLALL